MTKPLLSSVHADLIKVFDLDEDAVLLHREGRIEYANPRAQQLFDCATKECLGSKVTDWIPKRYCQVTKEQPLEPVPFALNSKSSEIVHTKNDRLELSTGKYTLTKVCVARADSEIFTDYQKLMTNSLHGFALFEVQNDDNGEPVDFIFLEVNQRFSHLTSLRAEQVLHKSIKQAIPGVLLTEPNLLELYSTVAKSKVPQSTEVHFLQEDQYYRINTYTNHPNHLAIIFENITKRKYLERKYRAAQHEAEESNRAKSAFLAAISHEVRTPLNGIIGASSMMGTTELSEDQGLFMDMLNRCSHNLLKLVSEILDFSKIESHQMELSFSPFSFKTLIHGCINAYEAQAKTKHIDLTFEIDPELELNLYSDSLRLHQILCGFLSNALKFTVQGSVQLKAHLHSKDNSQVILQVDVTDTGIGIAEADLGKVFSNFTQLDDRLSRSYEGTGLGLTLCKQLAEMLGGKISVQSSPGQGSTFSLIFPSAHRGYDVREIETVMPDYSLKPALEWGKKLPLKILAAEGNLINQRMLKNILVNFGYEPTLVSDGKAALEALCTQNFDLAFLDLSMPQMGGAEVYKRVKRHRETPMPYTVGLMGKAMVPYQDQSLELGINEICQKPFSKPKIEQIFERLAALQETQQTQNKTAKPQSPPAAP